MDRGFYEKTSRKRVTSQPLSAADCLLLKVVVQTLNADGVKGAVATPEKKIHAVWRGKVKLWPKLLTFFSSGSPLRISKNESVV